MKLIEDVIEEHLGWLIIWGNIFGTFCLNLKQLILVRWLDWHHNTSSGDVHIEKFD